MNRMLKRIAKGLIGLERLATKITPPPPNKRYANLSGLSKDLAFISKWAYQPKDKRYKVGEWEYVPEKSTDETAVYKRGNTIALGFRGTASIPDIKTDIKIALGSMDDRRFREADALYTSLKDGANIIATGHSLGGTIALALNRKYGVPVEVFNPGAGIGSIQINPNRQKAIIHLISGDIVSSLSNIGRLGQVEIYGWKRQPPHTIDNFL